MQTSLSSEFKNTEQGRQVEKILRNCVHCGLCNATCPTHELLGDELDGPRGRIYQMKQLFEGAPPTPTLRLHLDRCLLCRSCESTCPSGVQYAELLEISKTALDKKLPRPFFPRMFRDLLTRLIVSRVFGWLLRAGWFAKRMRILPSSLARGLPPEPKPATTDNQYPAPRHSRKVITLGGCVQSLTTPNTNLAAAKVLDQLGISLLEVKSVRCCGGVQIHTCSESNHKNARGRAAARAWIDQCMRHLERGAEAIIMTASGCCMTVKEYPRLFEDDPQYYEKALRVSEKTMDLSELVARELSKAPKAKKKTLPTVAFHAPCTLQHGQRIVGVVETMLRQAGYTVVEVRDSHLCCGSAGTYSILQPAISEQLRRDKQAKLAETRAEVICTANVGCQLQLSRDSALPVLHWIELLDRAINNG